MTLEFDTRFEPRYGEAVEIAPGIRRLTVRNPSPFTFHGTNSYILGDSGSLAVIDPGPEDDDHLDALLKAIGGRPLSHILVSHTHRDHSPLAARLAELTGAKTVAAGPHRPARPLAVGETNALDVSADTAFHPDIKLGDDELIEGDGWSIRAIHTPGHTANHLAFGLEGTGVTFSADHVMAWSTTIVAPPDGSMADYMASIDKLLAREDRLLLPGHGGPVTKPPQFLRGLRAHRKMRERAIVERLSAGDRTIADIVKAIYRDTDPRLHGAAALSVFAHLEDLLAKGRVKTEGTPTLDSIYIPA